VFLAGGQGKTAQKAWRTGLLNFGPDLVKISDGVCHLIIKKAGAMRTITGLICGFFIDL
jgi:hypothetical protein